MGVNLLEEIRNFILLIAGVMFMNFTCTHHSTSACVDAQTFIRNMDRVPIMNVYLLNQGSRCICVKEATTSDDFMKSKISNFEKEVAIIKGSRGISPDDKIVQMVNLDGQIDYEITYHDKGCKDRTHSMEITETQSLTADDGFCYRLLFISTDGHRTLSEVLLVSDSASCRIWAIYSSFIE